MKRGTSSGLSFHESDGVISNCIISKNSGDEVGAIYLTRSNLSVLNSVITGNRADENGGAITCSRSNLQIANCTITANSAPQANGIYFKAQSECMVDNCILWNGGEEIDAVEDSEVIVRYSSVMGGWPGEGNIHEEPRLGADDYHLTVNSSCIGAGDPMGDYAGQTDIDGEPRVLAGRVDIGADELDVNVPLIGLSTSRFTFVNPEIGINPEPQRLGVYNAGIGTLNWEISYDCGWLDIQPTFGQSLGELNEVVITPEIAGLDDGTHECTLTISDGGAANSPRIVEISLYVGTVYDVPHRNPTIQAAIDAAEDGDTIIVASGTYTGYGNRRIDFKGKAITVRSADGQERCTIDCEGHRRGFYFHSGEDANSILDGFTITNGYTRYDGGAIHCEDHSSPMIINCSLVNNTAGSDGGGMSNTHSEPVIDGLTFRNNTAGYQGGGLYNSWSGATITNCVFVENSSKQSGGGNPRL